MTKKEIIKYLIKNRSLISVRAVGEQSGFRNLYKVLNGQMDAKGNLFTFPDKHVKNVSKLINRLQIKKND